MNCTFFLSIPGFSLASISCVITLPCCTSILCTKLNVSGFGNSGSARYEQPVFIAINTSIIVICLGMLVNIYFFAL